MTDFRAITLRDGISGRRAVLRSGPDVWEVVMVARDYGDDREGLLAHFGGAIPPEELEQALAYSAPFRDEVESMIAGNEEVEQLLRS